MPENHNGYKGTVGDTMSCIVLMLLVILYCTCEGGIASTDYAQNRDRWWPFVNMVMNPHVP